MKFLSVSMFIFLTSAMTGCATELGGEVIVGEGETEGSAALSAEEAGSSPSGSMRARSRPGGISFTGMASDPDTEESIQIDTYVDGEIASRSHTDPATRRFAFELDLAAGPHTVCPVFLNVGAGSNTDFRCFTMSVLDESGEPLPAPTGNRSPTGEISVTTRRARPYSRGHMDFVGTAVDPDVPEGGIQINVYVNGEFAIREYTQPDGSFSFSKKYHRGTYKVCPIAVNEGPGSNSSFPCADITVGYSRNPF